MTKTQKPISETTVSDAGTSKRLITFEASHIEWMMMMCAAYRISYSELIFCCIELAENQKLLTHLERLAAERNTPFTRIIL